jgi:hypothetical protein
MKLTSGVAAALLHALLQPVQPRWQQGRREWLQQQREEGSVRHIRGRQLVQRVQRQPLHSVHVACRLLLRRRHRSNQLGLSHQKGV